MNFLRKIARAIDRWLASPHRAFLTWAICAAVVLWLGVWIATYEVRERVFLFVIAHSPIPRSAALYANWKSGLDVFLYYGFMPMILRLGLWRTLLWWSLAAITHAVYLKIAWALWSLADSAVVRASMDSWLVFTIPALTLIGRRTRPWMALIAGLLFGLALGVGSAFFELDFMHPVALLWYPARAFLGYIVAGAVLIYGTKLIVAQGKGGGGD